MKGVIDKIWENKTDEGKEYLVLSIGGERYSLWDEEQMGYLQEGTAVDYQWSPSGRFRKITEISKIEGELDPGAYEGKKTKSSEEIVRMSCVKSAAELVSRFDVRPEEKVDLTLGIARRFERYIKGVEEPADGQPMENPE